ncbi:MAG: DUF2892 domain-containing protein [Candidatus Dactylopiibacterium sp.]|nr:DUF2892 domain-containing protein [Candidatus Dactylopiibacterium sp.]
MKTNVGFVDCAVRVVLGAALVVAAALGSVGPWGWLGLILVASGAARFCPLYAMVGMSTCRKVPPASLDFHDDLPVHFHTDPKA